MPTATTGKSIDTIILDALEEEFQCPICFDLLSHPVQTCKWGHAVCSNCLGGLFRRCTKVESRRKCPVCRAPLLHGTGSVYLCLGGIGKTSKILELLRSRHIQNKTETKTEKSVLKNNNNYSILLLQPRLKRMVFMVLVIFLILAMLVANPIALQALWHVVVVVAADCKSGPELALGRERGNRRRRGLMWTFLPI
ncbi:hypothetical protein GGS20DRAFT_549147 [Poronia punctata]|nr:hypothetical protein GGS20DRAFT_549147 [Poronia punctata]